MVSASVLYPFNMAFSIVKDLVHHRGYAISYADMQEGLLKGEKRMGQFNIVTQVRISLYKLAKNTTQIHLVINDHEVVTDNPVTDDELEEKKFLEGISNRFELPAPKI